MKGLCSNGMILALEARGAGSTPVWPHNFYLNLFM